MDTLWRIPFRALIVTQTIFNVLELAKPGISKINCHYFLTTFERCAKLCTADRGSVINGERVAIGPFGAGGGSD